jgi:hypothetical protein
MWYTPRPPALERQFDIADGDHDEEVHPPRSIYGPEGRHTHRRARDDYEDHDRDGRGPPSRGFLSTPSILKCLSSFSTKMN